jgi:hypothetical protein
LVRPRSFQEITREQMKATSMMPQQPGKNWFKMSSKLMRREPSSLISFITMKFSFIYAKLCSLKMKRMIQNLTKIWTKKWSTDNYMGWRIYCQNPKKRKSLRETRRSSAKSLGIKVLMRLSRCRKISKC